MLKIRVIPTLLWKGQGLMKGEAFNSWRLVGSAQQAVKVFCMREVDELVLLDIAATAEKRLPDIEIVDELADDCFVPFSVGGGIRTLDDVTRLLRAGADKVVVNTAAVERNAIVREIASRFGSQCAVVSIDAKQHPDRTYEVFIHCGTVPTGLSPVEHALRVEALGAGEILLTSIERDGTMTGYDVELTRQVVDAVKIPVIASGGCGTYAHMADVLSQGGASAVAASAMFQFTQQTPREAKQYLQRHGFPVRI